jgi:hypothetical protein
MMVTKRRQKEEQLSLPEKIINDGEGRDPALCLRQ